MGKRDKGRQGAASSKGKDGGAKTTAGKRAKVSDAVAVSSPREWGLTIGKVCLSLAAGYFYYSHSWMQYDNVRNFSYLGTIERDISLHSEQALYYSYYKSLIEAPTAKQGLQEILYDEVTEYPTTFNVLKRFNLWPEVIIGLNNRFWVQTVAKIFNLRVKNCYNINRGEGKSQIESCVGWGDEHYFYYNHTFALNGFLLFGGLFYLCWTISNKFASAILFFIMFCYNMPEVTRCQWTPTLREHFSMPFLPLQMYFVWKFLKTDDSELPKKTSRSDIVKLTVATTLFILPWQFAQFAVLTQTASVLFVYLMDFITQKQVTTVLLIQISSLLINYILQFGNTMLLTSFGFSAIKVALVVVHATQLIHKNSVYPMRVPRILKAAFFMSAWLAGTFGMKQMVGGVLGVEDDAHIFDLLRAKFTSFKTFQTMIYLCQPEFDFISKDAFVFYMKCGLIPLVIPVMIYYGVQVLKEAFYLSDGTRCKSKTSGGDFYMVIQTVVFILLAILIMRLKLFMGLCMVYISTMIFKEDGVMSISNGNPTIRKIIYGYIALCVVAGGYFGGYQSIHTQIYRIQEFENIPLEEAVEWVRDNTDPKTTVFGGSMIMTSQVKNVCRRKITNHAHYENKNIRDITYEIYSVNSRRPLETIYKTLKKFGITHYIYEDAYCRGNLGGGANCQYRDFYDQDEPQYSHMPVHCDRFLHADLPADKFRLIFRNDKYIIYQVV